MRTLLFLCLIIFPLERVSAGVYQDYETHTWTVDGVPAPSCEVVKFRIQEFVRRELEADQIIEWYSPVAHTMEQRSALLEVFRRMPFFYDDRLYEHLNVVHEWRVDPVETEKLVRSKKMKTAFSSSKYGWTDSYNGLFPDDIKVEIKHGRITLKQKLSFQRFCLETPLVEVRFEGDDVSVVLQGENSQDLLQRDP